MYGRASKNYRSSSSVVSVIYTGVTVVRTLDSTMSYINIKHTNPPDNITAH